jgi:hypothetical protein
MRPSINTNMNNWFLAGIMALGLALRLVVAWQPVEVLVTKNLPDDAFYYFMLAHHAVDSGSVSVDGVHLTNGFHPLWLVMLLPIFGGSAPLDDTPVHLALTLASLLDLISIGAISQITLLLTKRANMGLLAAFVYAANPAVVLQITNGLETALAVATLILFWWFFIRVLQEPGNARLTFLLGIMAGLTFLARSDSAIYVACALVVIVARSWQHIPWRAFIPAGGIATAIVVPWFLWSATAVGSVFQESGTAVPYAIRERLRLELGDSLWVVLQETWRQLTVRDFWLRGDATGLPFVIGVVLWIVVLVGLAVRWRRSKQKLERMAVLPMLAAGVILILIHAGVRWYPRVWYFTPLAAVFAVTLALVADTFLKRERRLFATILFFSVYFAMTGFLLWFVGLYPWQKDMWAANAWITQHLQPDESIGSFNSGIYAYYSQRRVVNLDGVVNHAAYSAVKQKSMMAYLAEDDVDYLIDSDWAIHTEYAPFMGSGYPSDLKEVAILNEPGGGPFGSLRVYRVSPEPAR